ncbi:MAG TPA: hypothetical protein VLA83_05780 [Candidatus Binatia bacterium]|nr:hypothetical protein [Candidatus Binatia bacterium]
MKKFLAFIVLIIALIAPQRPALGLHATTQNSEDTLMLFAPQADDPVHIVQASFGADNLLLDARLENKSHNKIQVYRLGWVSVKKDDVRMGRGELVTVPEKVDTTAQFDIPATAVPSKEDLSRHPAGIVVYIAELQFQDGTKWQADGKKLKKEAIDMLK